MESIKSLWWCPWKNHEQGHPPLRRRGFIKSTPPEGLAAPPPWWWCLLGLCVVCFGLVVVCRQYERNPIRLYYVLCLCTHINRNFEFYVCIQTQKGKTYRIGSHFVCLYAHNMRKEITFGGSYMLPFWNHILAKKGRFIHVCALQSCGMSAVCTWG